MKETMTVAEALDERDFLAKKLMQSINGLKIIDLKYSSNQNLKNGINAEQFLKDGREEFQSIKDSISRYNRINNAIILSNANTEITLKSGIKMTVAEAISRKKLIADGIDFEIMLFRKLDEQYAIVLENYENRQKVITKKKNDLAQTILASSNMQNLDDNQVTVIDKMLESEYVEIVECLSTKEQSIDKVLNEMQYKTTNLLKEINSVIKISNATTTIEF